MEETQSHRQSPSVWGSTQDLASYTTTQEELVNDLKAVGTTVTKITISNTLHREGLKSCCTRKVPLLKKADVQACLKFAKEHLDDPEEAWEKVMSSVRYPHFKSKDLCSVQFLEYGCMAGVGGREQEVCAVFFPSHKSQCRRVQRREQTEKILVT